MIAYSVIQKSQLEGAHRLDAEYYQPEYLRTVENLNRLKAVPISEVAINPKRKFRPKVGNLFRYIEISEIDLNTGEYGTSNILGENTPDRAQWVVKKNDVIVSTVRPIRNAVSLIKEDKEDLVCSSGFGVLKTQKIEPEYLFVYLKAEPIVKLLDRLTTATMYPAVTIDDILGTKIYLGNEKFRQEIKNEVINAQKELEQSKILYSQAEDLLLQKLGLKDVTVEEDVSYVINLSDAKSTHRMDAEYFQPKYEQIGKILNRFKQEKLDDISSLISYGTVPTSPYVEQNGMPYVKGENLQNCFIDYSKLVYLDKESIKKLPKKYYLKEGDIIISQMGTVGRTGLVTKQEEGWLFASFTIRVRLKEEGKSILDPLFVTLYIQNISRPYYLLRRIAQASVRQNTDLPTIKDLRIPILPQSTQQKIADLVRKSHEARRKAKELLDEAKRKVENLVEKGCA